MAKSTLTIEKKGVGLNLNPYAQIHFTDHLAVVCILMDIPLVFIDEPDCNLWERYYPGLKASQENYLDFTPEYLITHYDVLFISDLWSKADFHAKYAPLEKKYKKQLRHVHCPHGFSDKGFYLQRCAHEDIPLIYGQNMLDQMKEYEVLDQLTSYVITGNYRHTYFKQHRQYYDKLMQEDVLNHFERPQPTILYAPTWQDSDEGSTFFDATSQLIEKLPSHYNMIVKPHPRLELDDAGQFYHLMGRCEGKKNIHFLKDFPLVFPLLAHTDVYIGDMSAIGYDFLAFNKPMFFLNKNRLDSATDRRAFLYRCGIEVMPEQLPDIYKIIEENVPKDQERFTKVRSDVYRYTFGEERSFAEIKADIIRAYNEPLVLE